MEQEHLILTIDDNPDFNKIVEAVLKKNKFKVITTTTPDKFLETLKKTSPSICLIDLNLDTTSGEGFQLIKAIRNKRGFDIPLLVLSRRSSNDDISHAMQVGATDYIQKPIDEAILVSKIGFALNLYEDDTPKFTFKKVSETLGECEVTTKFDIQSVDELGITILSKSLISKGTQIEVSGQMIDEITGKQNTVETLYVSKNWLEDDYYHMYLDFDSSDTELISNVRRWLVENEKNES